ncbi:MAG: CoA pyrophosphatase [Cyclobacteriaceae bacterium]|nr:CoA pyrophosphatase [Cyclobacteriaceae bacterium]
MLILLYPELGQVHFPLTRRHAYTGTHGGQVSLPGGKAEPGESAIETALREAKEEVGLNAQSVKVLGQLSDFFVIPSNFMVTPVVGVTETPPEFQADPVEVKHIFTGTLEALVQDDAVRTSTITVAGQFTLEAPHFEIQGEMVWGATAMMLNELRWIVREIMLTSRN